VYIVKIKADKSDISGKGVFAMEKIKKGQTVWLYDPKQDLSYTQEQFEGFDDKAKEWFYHSAYLSPWTGLWISPPLGDPSNFTNHSVDNNTTVYYDEEVSSEPFFVANRDIEIGEEITNNYYEFDEITKKTKPDWAKMAKDE
jgi:SET domain-containing protein